MERPERLAQRFGLGDSEEPLGGQVPQRHASGLVGDDDGGSEAADDRPLTERELVHLLGAVRELAVGRVELRVRRLQLLVRRLELLVGGLKLFVRRLQLLVRGLQLFVGRLQLLVGGLHLLVDRLQLLERGSALLGRLAQLVFHDVYGAHVMDEVQKPRHLARRVAHGRDVDADVHAATVAGVRNDSFARGMLGAALPHRGRLFDEQLA